MAISNLPIRVVSFFLLLSIVGTAMSANEPKYDWNAFDSAPEHYPMKIISSKLRYHGDPKEMGMPVTSKSMFHYRWGTNIDLHLPGATSILNPLPDKLDITFYSFQEDQFYQGSFDLPYGTILSRVQKDVVKADRQNYYHFYVGMAPGGTVAVWLRGKEIFFGQAKKSAIDFAKAFPTISSAKKMEYLQRVKMGGTTTTPEILADILKNGIPFQTWANYRTQYNWVPTFLINRPLDRLQLVYYNGQEEFLNFPFDQVFTTTHPVPRRMHFRANMNGSRFVYQYNVHFDEAETLEAFARIGARKLPMQLEFDPGYPVKNTVVRLRNATESITLKKVSVVERH